MRTLENTFSWNFLSTFLSLSLINQLWPMIISFSILTGVFFTTFTFQTIYRILLQFISLIKCSIYFLSLSHFLSLPSVCLPSDGEFSSLICLSFNLTSSIKTWGNNLRGGLLSEIKNKNDDNVFWTLFTRRRIRKKGKESISKKLTR